ncbi:MULTISPECIES: polymorphic toxin type 50 domain-containing protein [unclassified Halomonas]|uniref:polymorphic toxin type 50 domain-containing protein n=1 Tax=unclassified Halomonas TaxID=2609666 RepID=UPI001CF57716|nr:MULTISPECIES: polymorphic toxin type 50 domain-containing protein [unclassified Halomonas]UZH09852.1 polymorphic toxin type 50 domain-containing protein [Halomonas sp. BDJS001]
MSDSSLTICIGDQSPCEGDDKATNAGTPEDTSAAAPQGEPLSGQARHAGNAEARWRALTSHPDFCQVGDKIVGFDSCATLGNPVNYSPNVITAGQRTYRVGDLCQGTEGNAGSGVGSGTSQGSGHVLFMTGHDNVKANGQPVVRDGSESMINCNAAGVGGAKGYVHTNTESVNSQPEETSEPLSVAEQLQQEAQANLERVGELREALNDNPTGKTSEQALALRAQVEELAQTVEHQQQAMMEARRNGTLSDDELHDLMDYTNETTVSVLDLQDNAGRQTARANAKGTWVDFLIGFNPVIAGAQLLEGVGDGVRSGQYGQAMLPVLLDSTPIGRSLGSMVKKVFGGFKKPKRVDRDSSSSSANPRESGQDNEGLRVEENSGNVRRRLPVPENLPENIHPGQQGKHIPGHNNFTPGRSPLAEGINPQQLLDGVHDGTHSIVRMTPRGQPVVDFGKTIGQFEGNGTQFGIIHHGKNGAHIVPANPIQF